MIEIDCPVYRLKDYQATNQSKVVVVVVEKNDNHIPHVVGDTHATWVN